MEIVSRESETPDHTLNVNIKGTFRVDLSHVFILSCSTFTLLNQSNSNRSSQSSSLLVTLTLIYRSLSKTPTPSRVSFHPLRQPWLYALATSRGPQKAMDRGASLSVVSLSKSRGGEWGYSCPERPLLSHSIVRSEGAISPLHTWHLSPTPPSPSLPLSNDPIPSPRLLSPSTLKHA